MIESINEFELVCIGDLRHLSGYIIRLLHLTPVIITHLILHKLIWSSIIRCTRCVVLTKRLCDITFVINVFGHLLPVVEELLLVHPLVLLVAHLVIGIVLVHHLLLVLLCHGHSLLVLVPIVELLLLLLHFILILIYYDCVNL